MKIHNGSPVFMHVISSLPDEPEKTLGLPPVCLFSSVSHKFFDFRFK